MTYQETKQLIQQMFCTDCEFAGDDCPDCVWDTAIKALDIACLDKTEHRCDSCINNCAGASYQRDQCIDCTDTWCHHCEGEDCNKCFSPCDTCDYKLTCKVENCNCRICHHYGYCDHCEKEG